MVPAIVGEVVDGLVRAEDVEASAGSASRSVTSTVMRSIETRPTSGQGVSPIARAVARLESVRNRPSA